MALQKFDKQVFVQGLETAVRTGREIELLVFISGNYGFVDELEVLFNRYGQQAGGDRTYYLVYDAENSKNDLYCFRTKIFFDYPGYRTYVFRIVLNGKEFFIKNGENGPEITKENEPFFDCFVYEEHFETPDWVKGGIMYQIYPDTFYAKDIPDSVKERIVPWGTEPKWLPDSDGEYRNNRFFGGNIKGIIAKLPYIKSFGVTILYLTPIFKSPSSNRYDISDYFSVDEMIGDLKIYQELYIEAHKLGMHIVLDMVLNHCHPDNILYKTKPHIFTGTFWWGFKNLVEFLMTSPEYREVLRGILKSWFRYCDGVRLDVADSLSDEVLQIVREEATIAEKILGRKFYILGEVWKHAVLGDHRNFLNGFELDSVMNYQFTDAIYRNICFGDYAEFVRKVNRVLHLYPKCAIDCLMNPLSTHDIPRIPNILINPIMVGQHYLQSGEEAFIWDYDKLPIWNDENGKYDTLKRRMWEYDNHEVAEELEEYVNQARKLAVFMQYTLPGIPSIFAGDELGMTGLKDPFNRCSLPWDEGESECTEFYRKVGEFRLKNRQLFAEGECKILSANENILVYTRSLGKKCMTFVFNRSYDEISIKDEIEVKAGILAFSIARSTLQEVAPFGAVAIEN